MNKSADNLLHFNAFQLKLLACTLMLIDHVGYFLLPQYFWLRIIGRLAFPIFAYMVANSYRYSTNPVKYMLRLLVCAAVFQPIFSFCMKSYNLNIFFTLLLGMAAIFFGEKLRKFTGNILPGILLATIIAAIAELVNTDYGAYGVALIFTAHLFFDDIRKISLAWLVVNLSCLLAFINISPLQIYSIMALPTIALYNKQRGHGSRWLFIVFYCLHIPILYLIQTSLA